MQRTIRFLFAAAALYSTMAWVLSNVKLNNVPLIYRTANYYTQPGGLTWVQFREFNPAHRYGVVIVGSSHAYRGYDPEVFAMQGYDAFNLGSSSQTPLNSYWLIRTLLDSANTRLLVMDVYDTALAITGLESTMDLTQNLPDNGNEAAIGIAWAQRDLRSLNMIAVRFAADRSKPYFTDAEYMGRGFAPHLDSVKIAPPPPAMETAPLLPRQKYFIGQVITLCKKRGIPLVFASHFARRNLRGEFHESMVQFMDSIHTATGIPFLDYTRTPGIDDRDWFSDANHLNLTGARIFTTQLVDSLEKLGFIEKRQATPTGQ